MGPAIRYSIAGAAILQQVGNRQPVQQLSIGILVAIHFRVRHDFHCTGLWGECDDNQHMQQAADPLAQLKPVVLKLAGIEQRERLPSYLFAVSPSRAMTSPTFPENSSRT